MWKGWKKWMLLSAFASLVQIVLKVQDSAGMFKLIIVQNKDSIKWSLKRMAKDIYFTPKYLGWGSTSIILRGKRGPSVYLNTTSRYVGYSRSKAPFGSYGWNKEHWDFVPTTITLNKVNNELMINSFSVKLWSNVPNTEMWNVLLTVLACTLLKSKQRFPGFPVILSDELYWPLFCFFIWGYIRSCDTINLLAEVICLIALLTQLLFLLFCTPVLPLGIPVRA